jgi:hypothetical protein
MRRLPLDKSKGKLSYLRCMLCGGNHPLRSKIYAPPAQINQILYTQPGVTYAQYAATNTRARATHKPVSSAN